MYRELKKHTSDTSLQTNLDFWRFGAYVTLSPLIDLVNHYHPENGSDLIDFDLERSNHRTSLLTSGRYTILDGPVSYTYNHLILEPPFMVESYGMAFPNNPFAKLAMINNHVLADMDSPLKLRLCELIKDVSNFEPQFDEDRHQMLF